MVVHLSSPLHSLSLFPPPPNPPSSLSPQNEARKLNHAEVVEEDRRNKLPANWEARKRKAEWEANEEEARKVSSVPYCSATVAKQ